MFLVFFFICFKNQFLFRNETQFLQGDVLAIINHQSFERLPLIVDLQAVDNVLYATHIEMLAMIEFQRFEGGKHIEHNHRVDVGTRLAEVWGDARVIEKMARIWEVRERNRIEAIGVRDEY